jgi:glutamyl-tRNA reductase
MHILVSGVRHRTADIEIRERFALLEEEVPSALAALCACEGVEECAILTTCNRTEIYAVVTDTEKGLQGIRQFYRQFKGLDEDLYRQHTFSLLHEDAVMHLFRVASGIDSLILGEGQILGQVKDALSVAQREKSIGPLLDKLFKSALSVGKRVRTETGIAEKDVSVSLAAFEFSRTNDPDLMNRRITLIGGGKMAQIMMSLFKQGMTPAQQGNVMLVNRSTERLKELTDRFGFQGVSWEQMDQAIRHAEVLFVATGAPHIVLGQADFEGQGPKLVIDIAVPRNVDPRVAELPGIQLFNTDNLAGAAGLSQDVQHQLKQQAQAIIEEECANYQQWRVSLSIVPTLTRLRAKVESIRKAELAASPSVGENYDLIDTISKSLIQKILHDPTVRLKNSHNMADIYHQASVLSHLFNIDATTLEAEIGAAPSPTPLVPNNGLSEGPVSA